MKEENTLGYNLQLFAAEDDPANDPAVDDGQDPAGEKTFTQSEVTALLTREKKEGRRSVLNALGFKSVEDVKRALADTKDAQDEPNDDSQQDTTALDEALARAEVAEAKLACVEANVATNAIDDVLAIAMTKVSEEKKLTAVLAEMSKETRYASFFNTENTNNDDTGSDPDNSKKPTDKAGSFGARLASAQKTVQKKSTYF